ncbi:hypothetical protein E2C01_070115 [Portunus trituberculatus]|uniref:Uncharacterized protein n=1 Tax=Portunus trituberculatus TaxID=210409 RepID=A0A5B7HRV1_PORTR|nr:hypothetical protein [Portunus trituberculatus]
MAVALLVVTWLVTLTSLGCLAHNKSGKIFMDYLSSLCATEEDDDDNQVLAKGIGYFDGSPGMRRLVLVEDEEEEDEEEDEGDENSDKSSEKSTSTDKDRAWRPPRKGTYILQEATKDYVVELGTYRLQEDINEETEEDKIAYVLEGGTYILETERQQRNGGIGTGRGIGEDMGLKYGFVGGNIARIHNIEGLYGLIRQGEPSIVIGNDMRGRIHDIEGLYGLIRQGEPSIVIGNDRRGRIHDIEGLYGLIRQGETGVVIDNDRRGRIHDIEGLYGMIRQGETGGVINNNRIGRGCYEFRDYNEGSEWRDIERMTSVEIRDDVIGMERRRAETGISQRGSDEIGIEREREEIGRIRKLSLDDIMQRRNEIRQQIENGGETQEIRRINTQRKERKEDSIILSASSLADNNRRIIKEIVTKTTSEGGTMLNPRRSLGGARPRANTSSYTRRAASFPMDNYCPVQLLPRKLSLILEEEVK